MKKIIFPILIFTAFSSCKEKENTVFEGKIIVDSTKTKNTVKQTEILCFEFSKNKDTTDVCITIGPKNQVSGKMHWNPSEKDGAIGILKGTKKGDTIVADFDYMMEGNKELEEKVFVLKNNQLLELIGALENENGKLVIKNLKNATVRNALLLKDCSKIKFPN
jgi:hypothetical protein